jgi:hypothetical protein
MLIFINILIVCVNIDIDRIISNENHVIEKSDDMDLMMIQLIKAEASGKIKLTSINPEMASFQPLKDKEDEQEPISLDELSYLLTDDDEDSNDDNFNIEF